MHNLLAYQVFPTWLREALLNKVLTHWEAAEIFDLALLTPEGKSSPLPQHLSHAASRLHLWECHASPTHH